MSGIKYLHSSKAAILLKRMCSFRQHGSKGLSQSLPDVLWSTSPKVLQVA